MFVNVKKLLVEKASISKKPGVNSDGLKASDVDPHLVFHYGIPLGCCMFAYDSIQKILAISTTDGRIKLFGKDNSQALLESDDTVPSKFLEVFFRPESRHPSKCKSQEPYRGKLLAESSQLSYDSSLQLLSSESVWDLERRLLSHVHVFKEEITSFTVMQAGPYMYVGDSEGNIKVFKIEQEVCHVMQMKYTIPFSASHGNPTEVLADRAVISILPQPTAESKRYFYFLILLIFVYNLSSCEMPIFKYR
ncbi:Transducin/WD40 repeat-like superfamily protein isoform 1 [Gossypium australe]|uniref:Transducin/WD40 repeat-like superfamily protein isoform 1 n=1 Tax=Gossypium australe TaxID=47621 RepID=A0A5B6UNA7_9ROSI|nr:Transducin/WD40 repeat-like superfamily protein isoform 1 [Gossypium australe]